MEGLFSKRLKKALEKKTIPYPSLSRNLRKRLAMKCRDHNECESFGDYAETKTEALSSLERTYGTEILRVQDEKTNGDREATDFEDFLVFAYPHQVLDALEAFSRLLSSDVNKYSFQAGINAVLAEEESPWQMSDGRIYLVDSRFLDALKDQAEEEMKREGFLGAHEEFRDARSYLQAGTTDDAIHKANCAFESALKSLLNQREGTANDLLNKLREETDLLDAVSPEAQKVIILKVLQGLPVLRHKIGGHGQGAEPANVPRAYGDLAVNLAATYIKFLLDLKKEHGPAPKTEGRSDVDEDDMLF